MKTFTKAEVKVHNSKDSLWVIIHDKVYDLTEFIDEHPGGEEPLLDVAGTDATDDFEGVGHSKDARKMMETYQIGELVQEEKSEKC